MGLGGLAKRYTPPQSFWASSAFQPHYRWNEMHLRSPSGLDYGDSLPRAPYKRLDHAIVHSWREHHWFSWMFGVGAQYGSTSWSFNAGGHQGGEGCDQAAVRIHPTTYTPPKKTTPNPNPTPPKP